MRNKALKVAGIVGGVVGAMIIALVAKTLVDTSTVPPPPKTYDVAMYDVYSDLIPNLHDDFINSLIDPLPQQVLIRVETLADEELQRPLNSAIAAKRNASSLDLQKRFNLPYYDLFTNAEYRSIFKSAAACLAFQQKYPGYERLIALSAVKFNQDQTVAVVNFVEERGTREFCNGGSFANGGYRTFQKRGGKWRLLANQAFSDWAE